MEFEFFAWHTSITLKDDPPSQFKRKSERCQPHLMVNWAAMTHKTQPGIAHVSLFSIFFYACMHFTDCDFFFFFF